jgi:histidinol phosphatase-like PHP family hydrolase
MKIYSLSIHKNEILKKKRKISFEQAMDAMMNGKILDIIKHPNSKKYPDQKIFIIDIDDYCYLIPFVENNDEIFLKTIFPSRKYTKKYKGGKNHER